jgi:hypothetical protein
MHQETSLSLQTFVTQTRWDLPIWAGCHKFTDDGLAFVPFVLGDCLDDDPLLDFEDSPSPGSTGLGGGVSLASRILDPQVLEPGGHLMGDLPSVFPVIQRLSSRQRR